MFLGKLDKDKIDFYDAVWRHPVPKDKKITLESMAEMKILFGNVENHISEFEEDQQMLSKIDANSFIQYSIPKKDVESINLTNLKKFISRITRNEKLTLAVQGKLYISTYGYELDSREVYQIPEIQRWAAAARKDISEWYLCAGEVRFSTLMWIATSTCALKSKPFKKKNGRILVESDPQKVVEFMKECFRGLNEATNKWGWSTKYNHKISKKFKPNYFHKLNFLI